MVDAAERANQLQARAAQRRMSDQARLFARRLASALTGVTPLAWVYRYSSYRYTGISITGKPVRDFPVAVFPTFLSKFSKIEFLQNISGFFL